MKVPTLSDIAREANVSKSLVSKALRHHPKVSKATAARIERLAEEMGYQPNPMLSALAARHFRGSDGPLKTPVAFVTHQEAAHQHHKGGFITNRMAKLASEIGYELKLYQAWEYPSYEELGLQLAREGVQGVVFAPIYTAENPYESPIWDRFAIVMLALGCVRHPFSSISLDVSGGMETAWRKIAAAGYRRIGLAHHQDRTDVLEVDQRIGSYLVQQMEAAGDLPRIPVLRYQRHGDEARLKAWYEAHRPEVIVAASPNVVEQLESQGIRVPGNVACVSVFGSDGAGRDVTGLVDMRAELCQNAIQLLDQKIRFRELGKSRPKLSLFVMPHWNPGETLPPLPAANRATARR